MSNRHPELAEQTRKIRDQLLQGEICTRQARELIGAVVAQLNLDSMTAARARYEAYPIIAALYPNWASRLLSSYDDVVATGWTGPTDRELPEPHAMVFSAILSAMHVFDASPMVRQLAGQMLEDFLRSIQWEPLAAPFDD